MSSKTDSSVIIKWRTITNVPDELSDYYQYVIEYKEVTSSDWTEWGSLSHDPSSDQRDTPTALIFQSDNADKYQEATLTGLTYNTGYDVRVKSYRVLGSNREETGITQEYRIQTTCRGR